MVAGPRTRPGRRAGARRVALALLALSGLGGCARQVSAAGTMVRPAPLPVRTHPVVFLVPDASDAAADLTARLAAHLEATSRSQVFLLEDARTLEARRRAGQFPPASAVVHLATRYAEDVRTEWVSRPQTVCGPVTCYTTRRNVLEETARLSATVRVRVFDGPTARLLAEKVVGIRLEGRSPLALRDAAVGRLEEQLADAVDARELVVSVVLPRFPRGDVALEEIARGDWTGGRRRLEAMVQDPTFLELPPKERAKAWYALGHARQFDPAAGEDPGRFGGASDAFARAAALAPRERRYLEAQAVLTRHRELLAAYEAQRAAALRNFTYADQIEDIPAPPASYQE